MASPRPAAAQQLRLADAHPRAGGSEINFSAQRQRQAAQLAASAALAALGDDSPISDDDQSHSERMPLNSRGGGGGVGSSSSNAGLVARGSASPSGFGLSSSLHPFPPPGSSPGGFAQKREKMKGHPVLRLNQSVRDAHCTQHAMPPRRPSVSSRCIHLCSCHVR